jgi:hypothetical protein
MLSTCFSLSWLSENSTPELNQPSAGWRERTWAGIRPRQRLCCRRSERYGGLRPTVGPIRDLASLVQIGTQLVFGISNTGRSKTTKGWKDRHRNCFHNTSIKIPVDLKGEMPWQLFLKSEKLMPYKVIRMNLGCSKKKWKRA